MPVKSRRQGDDLLVDNVDLKRAARNLLNKTRATGRTPPSDLNQAMELMASCFGFANLLAANQQAVRSLEIINGLVYQTLQPGAESRPEIGAGLSVQIAPTHTSLGALAEAGAPAVLAEGVLDKMQLQNAGVSNVMPGAPASPAISDAEQALVDRLMTSRRDGRQMMRIGVGLEDLAARADALAAAGPETARAALENATTSLVLTPGSSSVWHPTPDTFPADCGPRFDQRWKNLASAGFYSSLAGVAHSGEIVAIIGMPGAGKSLLVNAMAKSIGGAIVDFRLKTWQEDFDRVRRAPPSLVFIEELYHHSEATEMEVAAFALAAKSTKTVFVFQNYDTLVQSMLSRRSPKGKPLFTLARVLDLDRMTLNTAYAEKPMAIDQWHQDLGVALEAAEQARPHRFEDVLRESVPGKQIPVIVAADDVPLASVMNRAIRAGAIRTAYVVSCTGKTEETLSDLKRRGPDVFVFDQADKVPSEFLSVVVSEAINTGYRVCLRVSDPLWKGARGLDLGGRFEIRVDEL